MKKWWLAGLKIWESFGVANPYLRKQKSLTMAYIMDALLDPTRWLLNPKGFADLYCKFWKCMAKRQDEGWRRHQKNNSNLPNTGEKFHYHMKERL